MKVWFVGAGAGDPDLLTVKAHKLISGAECCIWAGSLINPEIMKLVPAGCNVYDSSQMCLEEIVAVMLECRDENIDVIRLHTGDPSIYGAIAEQMRALKKHNIEYDVVPGISSFQAAAASLCAELTVPGISQSVILTRGEGRTPVPDGQQLEELAKSKSTLCIYLSMSMLDKVKTALTPSYGGECPAAVVYHASWADEEIIITTLGKLADDASHITKTAVIIVGKALSGKGVNSLLYDKYFTHEFRDGVQ
jgi:precorrin-4/cobalt-precorrin-4 C11-methyltransferase